jgi:hypothetical protein
MRPIKGMHQNVRLLYKADSEWRVREPELLQRLSEKEELYEFVLPPQAGGSLEIVFEATIDGYLNRRAQKIEVK